jgi:PAS domain S-box-containing protein
MQTRELINGEKGLMLKNFIKLLFPSTAILFIFIVTLFFFFIPHFRNLHIQQKSNACKYLVQIVIDYLTSLNSEVIEGKVTLQEAQRRATTRIRNLRFGNISKDYFWIIKDDGRILMHPFRVDIENKDPSAITGPDGQILAKLMAEMTEIAKDNPEGGTISYIWNRRDEINKVGPKIAYVKLFKPWGWVIGTGIYIDEAEMEIASWKNYFAIISLLVGILSALISLIISHNAYVLRKKEKLSQELLIESEKNLRIREELFRSIFEKSPHAIVITDEQSKEIITANNAFWSMTGYSPDDFIGYQEIHIISDEEARAVEENIKYFKVAEKITSIILTKNNGKRDIFYSVVPINYQGRSSLLKMIVDVTEERTLEEQLRHSQKMEVIGKLTGGLVHDFNNLLSVITGTAGIMHIRCKDPEEAKHIQRIIDTAEKGASLIKKLLIFSRKDNAVLKIFDIHNTIKSTAEILSHTLSKNIKITLKLNSPKTMIKGDPALIENCLLNIGINARDAMPEGGEITFATKTILLPENAIKTLRNSRNEEYIQISISDTGSGIAPENLSKIFEPFFTTKPPGQGTGLGLAAVYDIIKKHNGTIEVESKTGYGTVFHIYLPFIHEEEE